MPSDKTYQSTKEIILGSRVMNPDFKPLADFIDKKFNVKVINIIYGFIDSKKTPRLEICLEFESEKNSFYRDKNDRFSNFDKKKQQIIAEKFEQLADKKKYKTKNIWVFYSAFEPVAKIEAIEKIPQEQINKLKKELANNELWEISRGFSRTTFFLNTNEQVKRFENSPLKRKWTDKYFEILKTYDEFAYFSRDKFDIYLDSKENFDNIYQSNWYYYYK